MPRHARNRRRSLSPGVHPLEGRELLSGYSRIAEAARPSRADVSDRDDAPEVTAYQAIVSHPVAARAMPSPAAEPSREFDAVAETGREADPPDEYSSAGPSDVTPSATIAAPAPPDASAADDPDPDAEGPPEVGRRADALLGFNGPGIGAIQSAAGNPGLATPVSAGEASPGPAPLTRPSLAPGAAREPGLGLGDGPVAEPEIPVGAGLIARAMPFSGELLGLAVDDVMERFDDLGVLDAVEELASSRAVAFGAACAATAAAIGIVRRLHRVDSDRINKRKPFSGRIVPGLRPARSS